MDKELNDEITPEEDVRVELPGKVEETKESETVTVPKGVLEDLMARVSNMENGNPIQKPKRITEHHADIRLHEGKPVLRIAKTWVENRGTEKERMLCTIEYKDGEDVKTAELNYLDFLNEAPKEKVRILSQKAQDKSLNQGMVGKRDTKTDNLMVGEEISLDVTIMEYISEVEFMGGELAGQKLTVNEEALNL